MSTREEQLLSALVGLWSAFIMHRSATHVVQPQFCQTCRESDAAIAYAQQVIEADPVTAGRPPRAMDGEGGEP